jgi:hypothetical protein
VTQQLSQGRSCPSCGSKVSVQSQYCTICGKQLLRHCPYCGSKVSVQSQYCTTCGKQLPRHTPTQQPSGVSGESFAPATKAPQQPVTSPKQRKRSPLMKWGLLGGFGLLTLVCAGIILASFIFRDELGISWLSPETDSTDVADLPFQKETLALVLEPRGADGTVAGSYRSPDSSGDQAVHFSVTPDGTATFRLEGSPASETLLVQLPSGDSTSLSWNGIAFDGMGALNSGEKVALSNLMESDLAHALSMIPLDLGCRSEEDIAPQQLAALLVPWQMQLKYLSEDRLAEVAHLAEGSVCSYFANDASNPESSVPKQLMLSNSTPIPVVFGYFPFDAEGVAEPNGQVPFSQLASLRQAQGRLLSTYAMFSDGDRTAVASPLFERKATGLPSVKPKAVEEPVIIRDVEGPCGAKCRGACGVDCTLTNCTYSQEYRCVVDQNGKNTGNRARFDIYDCGVHQGCIDHDACYDECNRKYQPCGSWKAALCRHHPTTTPELQPDYALSCDSLAFKYHGRATSVGWALGYGPFQTRLVFEYRDKAFDEIVDLERCPVVLLTITPQDIHDGKPDWPYPFLLRVTDIPATITRVLFEWDFGDPGTGYHPATGEKSVDVANGTAEVEIEHKYKEPGSHLLKVSVYDDTSYRGNLIAQAEASVVILAEAAHVVLWPTVAQGDVGAEVPFSASMTPDGDYRYDWDFGDGKTLNDGGPEVSHAYQADGKYIVTIRVYGRDGQFVAQDSSAAYIGDVLDDSDGDGVPDDRDLCPDTPPETQVDEYGCPDSDGDGVPDDVDGCPDTPPGTQVNEDGCPDADGDGAPDDVDLCPDTPPGTEVDELGCALLDSDRDGVPDDEDLCPDTPQGTEVDELGCALDSDGDGVPDDEDLCLDTPPGTEVDELGCALPQFVELSGRYAGSMTFEQVAFNSQALPFVDIDEDGFNDLDPAQCEEQARQMQGQTSSIAWDFRPETSTSGTAVFYVEDAETGELAQVEAISFSYSVQGTRVIIESTAWNDPRIPSEIQGVEMRFEGELSMSDQDVGISGAFVYSIHVEDGGELIHMSGPWSASQPRAE